MSSELERQLRDVRAEFPRPDEETMRALEQEVVARRPRPRRARFGIVATVATAVAVGVAIGVLAGASSPASGVDTFAAAPGDPTIFVRRYKVGQVERLDLTGRIPVDRAGEVVEILERECGNQHFRIATGVQTTAGGFWSKIEMFFFSTVTYVARWNGRLSDEATVRSPLYVLPYPLKNRRWRIVVNTRLQSMVGKTVVVQRRTRDDRWVRIRSAKLRTGSGFGSFQAVFTIPTRGLRLRAVVSQADARPCHDAAVSPTWPS